jgi:hypothetical protein
VRLPDSAPEKEDAVVSSPQNPPDPLPREAGYTHLLGVPVERIERLRSLYVAALDGRMSSSDWTARHASALAEMPPTLGPGALRGLEDQVNAMATGVTEDFDHFLFLSHLAMDLHLLQAPDPERELHDLEQPLSAAAGETSRAVVERRLAALRTMTGRREVDTYQPAARMFKALQVGTLEETYRWLRTAIAENPAASVQDLLTRAAVEVAEAKLELDRYDDLNGDPGDFPA